MYSINFTATKRKSYLGLNYNGANSGYNNINNPYAKLWASNVVKNSNVKVFILMSRTNETRHAEWHETCKCKCRLNGSACNDKQCWKINPGVNAKNWLIKVYVIKDLFGIRVIVSEKSCDFSENLDYKSCECRKKLVDKLIEQCTENVDEIKIAGIALFEHGNECVCSYYFVLS